jgi:leucyl aminopeptidase
VGWLLGVGDGSAAELRTAGAALIRALDARAEADHRSGRSAARVVQVALPGRLDDRPLTPAGAAALATGITLGGYGYRVTGSQRPPRTRGVELLGEGSDDGGEVAGALRRAAVLAAATGLARDLANTPSDTKDPAWLAGTAQRLADVVPGLAARVHDQHWLAANGFGGILAVGGGSDRPPRLLELRWRPRGVGAPHLVLVGKGITFDTGGVSIKPAADMHLMRTDMSGGAAVIAALLAIARLRLPVRVTGLVPAAENHLGAASYRPGDVVRQHGGITTEIANTDAEGRLVLADALAYARLSLRPDVLVDVATLTGAMKIGLGLRTGGLFASDDELAARLAVAGERAGEQWWRMPLLAAHEDAVSSQLADVRQAPGGPGAVTAALFLRRFTGGLPWAHLDIAGPARAEQPYAEVTPGGTGFAARTLIELAAAYCAPAYPVPA